MEQARRLNPHPPAWYLGDLGQTYRWLGRYTESVATLQECINLMPNAVLAHVDLATSYLLQWLAQENPIDQTLDSAKAEVQQALALNGSLLWNYTTLSYIELNQRQYDEALAAVERAVSLAPNNAWSYATLAEVLSYMGRMEGALEAAAQALRLKSIIADGHLAEVGIAYAVTGNYGEARPLLQRYLVRYPNYLPAHLTLAFVDSELGQDIEAQREVTEVLRLNPKFSLEAQKQRMPIRDPETLERYIATLRKAGLK
jgi:adenylate cyclase